jgi:hypothetical protein
VASGCERLKLEIPYANAFHFFHEMACLEKPVAQRIAARFGERHFIPGRILAANPRQARAGEARQIFDLGEREKRF